MTTTACPLSWPRNTIDLAISATEQPIAAAASTLVRVGCSNSTTWVSMPASRSSCEVRRAVGCRAGFIREKKDKAAMVARGHDGGDAQPFCGRHQQGK